MLFIIGVESGLKWGDFPNIKLFLFKKVIFLLKLGIFCATCVGGNVAFVGTHALLLDTRVYYINEFII
jgi:hypothetical protein